MLLQVTATPELLQSNVNIILSPSRTTTTNQSGQHNIPIWGDSNCIEENDLDNIQFEYDELTDNSLDNNKEVLKDSLSEKGQYTLDLIFEETDIFCMKTGRSSVSILKVNFEQIIRQFDQINRKVDQIDKKFVNILHKVDDIYEYLSSDRVINAIQHKFFVEVPEPLCSRTYSACTSEAMRRLFAAFGLEFEKGYRDLWVITYPASIRPRLRPKSIEIDLFGFAHVETNASLPSITSPNLDPVDSYSSFTKLEAKAKEFRANQILLSEITTSCLDFENSTKKPKVSLPADISHFNINQRTPSFYITYFEIRHRSKQDNLGFAIQYEQSCSICVYSGSLVQASGLRSEQILAKVLDPDDDIDDEDDSIACKQNILSSPHCHVTSKISVNDALRGHVLHDVNTGSPSTTNTYPIKHYYKKSSRISNVIVSRFANKYNVRSNNSSSPSSSSSSKISSDHKPSMFIESFN
ncbi:unnamed protein product [Rotaria socialis]|uniref:Uncharacterized protein n=1 Tax=Rotaria socialis TaxID=392032 RepID=A0A820MZ29_9BILA|nr:unnamed protein product [Rotaria socialis]